MDNNFLIVVLLMIMGKSKGGGNSTVGALGDFIKTMEFDDDYTLEKINIVRKIGPYFPENYIPLINNSVSFTEKVIKFNEILNFNKKSDKEYILEHIPIDDTKERLRKIVSTIQKEYPDSKINKNGTILDLILNMDKYKKIFEILNQVMSSGDSINDPSQLINLTGPLMGGSEEENKAKSKEMAKMLDMIKLLDNPKKKSV